MTILINFCCEDEFLFWENLPNFTKVVPFLFIIAYFKVTLKAMTSCELLEFNFRAHSLGFSSNMQFKHFLI